MNDAQEAKLDAVLQYVTDIRGAQEGLAIPSVVLDSRTRSDSVLALVQALHRKIDTAAAKIAAAATSADLARSAAETAVALLRAGGGGTPVPEIDELADAIADELAERLLHDPA